METRVETDRIAERKKRWVEKNFGVRKSPYDVLRALGKLDNALLGAERNLIDVPQVKLGITIIRAYLEENNQDSMKIVCGRFPGRIHDQVRALQRVRSLLTNGRRRHLWSRYY